MVVISMDAYARGVRAPVPPFLFRVKQGRASPSKVAQVGICHVEIHCLHPLVARLVAQSFDSGTSFSNSCLLLCFWKLDI
jgi:hypothetical protein